MAVTAKDIARTLNLSPSTVSMALNDHPGISEFTKQKVCQTALDLGYKLPSRHMAPKLIQFVIFKKHQNIVTDTAFFSELTQGLEAQTKKCNANLLIHYFYRDGNIKNQLQDLANAKSAGIILLATEMEESDFRYFSEFKIPIVILDGYFPNQHYDCICINNQEGAKNAVRHLIENGHREIGYLSSKIRIRNFDERKAGFLDGIRSIKTPPKPAVNIIEISATTDAAIADMEQYLASHTRLPSAFFADNDIIATSCMRALKSAGYRIPEDISIIGFDDIPICEIVDPPLTTIQVPKRSLGRIAVNRLIQCMQGETEEIVLIRIATDLVERSSIMPQP